VFDLRFDGEVDAACGERVGRDIGRERGANDARDEGDDADGKGREFEAQRFAEEGERAFGGAVDACAGFAGRYCLDYFRA